MTTKTKYPVIRAAVIDVMDTVFSGYNYLTSNNDFDLSQIKLTFTSRGAAPLYKKLGIRNDRNRLSLVIHPE